MANGTVTEELIERTSTNGESLAEDQPLYFPRNLAGTHFLVACPIGEPC